MSSYLYTMTSSFQTTYFYQIDGTAAGTFNLTPTNLKINQVAQNATNLTNTLDVNLPVNTRFTIIDNFSNESIVVSNAAASLLGTELDVPITVISVGAFSIGSTCLINIDRINAFSELQNVSLTAEQPNDLLQYDGTNWINTATINSDKIVGQLALSQGGTGSGAAQFLNGTMVTSNGAFLSGTKTTPSGEVIGDTDAQALTNKTIDGALNTISNLDLTTTVTGVLPLNNGGTGSTALNLLNGTMVCSSGGTLQGLKFTPTGAVLGDTDTQTLTNKDLTSLTNTFRPFVMPMAEVYNITPANTLNLAVQNTWYQVPMTGAVLVSNNSKFSAPKFALNADNLQWISAMTCKFHTAVSLSMQAASAGEDYEVAIALNNTLVPYIGTIYGVKLPTNNVDTTFACHKVLDLVQNDTVNIIFRCVSGNNRNLTFNNINFVMMCCDSFPNGS